MPPLTLFAEPLEVTQADNAARAQAFAERAEALVSEAEASTSATAARAVATRAATEAASARHFGWSGGAEGWLWAHRARVASDRACDVALRLTAEECRRRGAATSPPDSPAPTSPSPTPDSG